MPEPIQKQVQLPLSRAIAIAWVSLKVRMGRSVLTLITIVMAIAFLTNVWASRSFEPHIRNAWLLTQGVTPTDPGAVGGLGRTLWLLGLSLLVCAVGISNAMLMSVMERFREIGTMKCLGALDSFILKLFFLESMFLGAAGAVLGAFLGVALTVLLLMRNYGPLAWRQLPWNGVLQIAAASVAIGLAITAAAALYPAWKAARMEPIAAMRVEV
jgi:ABC-type antimicrobial peptide transport system permease subunit